MAALDDRDGVVVGVDHVHARGRVVDGGRKGDRQRGCGIEAEGKRLVRTEGGTQRVLDLPVLVQRCSAAVPDIPTAVGDVHVPGVLVEREAGKVAGEVEVYIGD